MNNVTENRKETDVNREYKDSVFCDLFSDRKNALSLYNAINGTNYTDETEIEITTMDDVIFLHQKNDVSFLFDSKLTLWEHQSTLNYNMPIRGMMYYSRNLEGILGDGIRKLYRKKLVELPAPNYYVLYNGADEMPEYVDLKLSDAFLVPVEGYEFTAHMININVPNNIELMDKCPVLKGYATLVKYARDNIEQKMSNEEAVDKAVERCISEGILAEYLIKKRSEAKRMFLTEFDEAAWEKTIREEEHEEGKREGIEEGRKEGREEGREEKRAEDIVIFITDKREDGVSEDKIREKLKKYYDLEDGEIDTYLSGMSNKDI